MTTLHDEFRFDIVKVRTLVGNDAVAAFLLGSLLHTHDRVRVNAGRDRKCRECLDELAVGAHVSD